jgi:phosphodiesterase/alkaline phosphatase D-like protein
MQIKKPVSSRFQLKPILGATVLLALASDSAAETIPLVNPSAEINNGVDGTLVSDPSVLGWDGTGTLSEGSIDYGNGRWKLRFEDSESIRQLTNHPIATGDSYSLRFDAAINSGASEIPDHIIVGAARLNGDFNGDTATTDSSPFSSTPGWFNLDGDDGTQATRLETAALSLDGSRNAVVTDGGTRLFALDTLHDLTTGEVLRLSYYWRDASGWDDASDEIAVTIFTTSDNTPAGTRTVLGTLSSGTVAVNSSYEFFSGQFAPIPAGANGKRLFVYFQGVDGNGSTGGFARVDNFVLQTATPVLIAPGIWNGGFNQDSSATDSRNFDETPYWSNLGGASTTEAIRTNLDNDGTRNAVLNQSLTGFTHFANDTYHALATGEVLTASFVWRDALSWNDASDRVAVSLFITSTDTIGGTPTIIQTLYAPVSTTDSTWESFAASFSPIPASANGKRLFVSCQADDGNGDNTGFARLDNFGLTLDGSVPPPSVAGPASFIVDAYIDNVGTPEVIATRTFPLTSLIQNRWAHYHFAIPAGTLDAHAGEEIGIRFRGTGTSDGLYVAIDNIRLDSWTSSAPDGSFSMDWNATPNQVWTGPGTWANRLHDWQVAGNRINCINGSRERRTLHRVGTTIRGDGENFSLSVRTGIHTGTNASSARSGFLIGAGPNLDWRGALLVQDVLGRDFGLFLGLRNDGAVAIEDYSTGAVTTLASGNAAGFTENSRLELNATYLLGSGEYTLTVEAFNSANALLSTAATTVSSDRVLGSFGLLSHRGSGDTGFWFDDFSGTGPALNPEPDRHLAIIGAIHTLSRGTLKLTGQMPPIDLTATPSVDLETWNGSSWQLAATAPIDITDNLSSYNATFKITGWDDTADTDYRVRIAIDGSDYFWNGTVRRDPVDKNHLVIASTTCQRISDQGLENAGVDWTPVIIWHPHTQTFNHIAKQGPDVLLALGDQIYEGQPTPMDNSSDFNRHHDYLYKWYLWMLQARDLARDIPTITIPDDHDIYQGNLWGEGGISSNNQNEGGYIRPASWVKMVERTQTRNLPDPDPYNPIQPAPTVAQGIEVYFTGMTYGRVGFAILEARKFKTGGTNPPADPNELVLLGERQHDFLRAWNQDWAGQDLKLVTSQSPLGNLHTHGSSGYNFGLNDKDTHGWPLPRRNEAWELLRISRMFQLAGDQHLATVAHHGINSPRDAGFSFTAPAIANFFPRVWDPIHNAGGKTLIVSPYLGDFFFNNNGLLPSGEPNLNAADPAHMAILAAANPHEYHYQSRGIDPLNLHDRGAGYGMTRIDKTTRQVVFECWPIHADPEFPQTGSQFPDWPITINQADNDGRTPTGYLPVIDSLSEKSPVVSVYDETTEELIYALRIPGNLIRPPVYDNGTTYRVEIAYGDEPVSETRTGQTPSAMGTPAVQSFIALQPSIITGSSSVLQWNVESPTTLTIDQGEGDVTAQTVNGIGYLVVTPTADTTYTLTLNGVLTEKTTVRVFPGKQSWLDTYFNEVEQGNPAVSGDSVDDDGDGFTNGQEFLFQTNPRDPTSLPNLTSNVIMAAGEVTVDFSSPFPLGSEQCIMIMEASSDLDEWFSLPSNSYQEIGRNSNPAAGTTQITIRFTEPIAGQPAQYYRASWKLN